MNARMVLIPSAGKGPATKDLKCECGEEIGVEECWECGAVLCSGCVRIRWVDGYEVVLCPMCAPALNPRGDE